MGCGAPSGLCFRRLLLSKSNTAAWKTSSGLEAGGLPRSGEDSDSGPESYSGARPAEYRGPEAGVGPLVYGGSWLVPAPGLNSGSDTATGEMGGQIGGHVRCVEIRGRID